ncbi:MAG: CRISPR-associated endonuclease Cas2 [bacterium]|nr:CRISPR-associated endonuclease Cas2 [bacterium]
MRNKSTPSKQIELLRYGLNASRIFLSDLASLMGHVAYAAGHNRSMGWAEYEDMRDRQLRREEREQLRYLQRKKFVETKRVGEKLMVRLTGKGWQQALRDKIKCTRSVCKDGICIVIFDVPESERHVRDALRWILSECGFTMLQKSVWMTNKDVVEELCALLQGAKLDRWVRILIGNELRRSAMRRIVIKLKAKRKRHKPTNA